MKVHQYKKEIINICKYNHLTVDNIFEKIKKIYPKIGKSTIYRNVEEMASSGDLIKIKGNSDKNIYEANIGNHCHFFCLKTGKIIDINIKNIEFDIPDGLEINNIEINVYGNSK